MSKKISVTEIARNFSAYINRVTYRGESFELTRGGIKVAELRAAPQGCTVADFKRLILELPELGDAEVALFENDLTKARRAQRKDKLRDPWVS